MWVFWMDSEQDGINPLICFAQSGLAVNFSAWGVNVQGHFRAWSHRPAFIIRGFNRMQDLMKKRTRFQSYR